jgi:hypothetical protein
MKYEARKFAYKHPTFGRSKTAKASEPFKNSIYYYWWEFLRRNESYRKSCINNGSGNFTRIYKDFGDVFHTDFKSWWNFNNRGVNLFSEKPLPQFKLINEESLLLDSSDVIYLQIPLQLPKRYLSHEFQNILNKHHHGRRGVRANQFSTAQYPVIGHVDLLALDKCLMIHDYKKMYPSKTLWEIGNDCKILKQSSLIKNPNTDLDFVAKKTVLANTTKRLLSKAEAIIKNVGKGIFPKAN